MQAQDSQPDWLAYTRGLRQANRPGSVYAYCSGGINLVGGAIARANGRWLPEYFADALADPLEIRRFSMNLMPNGEGYAGGGLYLRPRDFLKLGELYLRGGRWRGRRIVDASWVRRSVARQQLVTDGADDGYAWHRHTLMIRGRPFSSYEASGNGGQFVVVIPALDLVIAVTAGHYGEGSRWLALREQVIAATASAAVPTSPRAPRP